MLIIQAFLESIAAAFVTTLFFGNFIVSTAKPIVNGLISFITKVPATDDQAKAVVFVVLVLMTFVPLLNRIIRKKATKPQEKPKEKRKHDQEAEFRLTDDGELEEVVEDI
jgi:Na+-transporting methylmalonyl-CoA/oxaloacetate decarboxylase gamma subunit